MFDASATANDNPAARLAAVVDSLREAAGATPREMSPMEELLAASASCRAEFGRMVRLLDAVMARHDAQGSTVEQAEALAVWAAANTAVFSFAQGTLEVTNAALAQLA